MKTIIKSLYLMAALALIPGLSWAEEATCSDPDGDGILTCEIHTTISGMKVDTSGEAYIIVPDYLDTCGASTWIKLSPTVGTELAKNRMIALAMMAKTTNATVSVTYSTSDCTVSQLTAETD